MQNLFKISLFLICIVFYSNANAQCVVNISNIQHVSCPSGGPVGGASIIQASYINYSWKNIISGQIYASGPVTSVSNLDAGLYIVIATNPYSSSCPSTIFSDTFEILESNPIFVFSPAQACPLVCNVSVAASMQTVVPGVIYSYQFGSNPIVNLPNTLSNQCGGLYNYEIFANNISCGLEDIGIAHSVQMNLATSITNTTCNQLSSATVTISSIGVNPINNYCASLPLYDNYTTIDNVILSGDNTIISNNTSGACDTYGDYTAQSADLTIGYSYSLDIDLGNCINVGLAIANVYIDWNIDGDFNDLNELVGQVNPTQSPSSHSIIVTVPFGANPGFSRMRIIAQDNQFQPSNQASPCDMNAYFGSTEDYTVVINGSIANPITYLWSNGQTSQTATNLTNGINTITVTDANGCSIIDTLMINGSAIISVTAGSDQTICNGYAPSSLNASSGGVSGTYSWVNASNPSVILGSGSNFSPPPLTATTTYTVTFTDVATGCTATDDVVITVVPLTTPIFNQIAPICAGGSLTLPIISTNGISGSWSPAPNLNTTTTYTFSPTGNSSCVTNATMTVNVNPIPTVTLAANPNPACIGNNIVLTASSTLAGLYRFQYNSGGGWFNFTNPAFSSLSNQTFYNLQNSTDFRVKVRENYGCANSTWSTIVTVPINNIITQPISHN